MRPPPLRPYVIAFTTTHWCRESIGSPRIIDPVFGLGAWYRRVKYLFSPIHTFLACGNWSDPFMNPLPGVSVVNAGLHSCIKYDLFRSQLCMAAYTAAMAYVLNRSHWDLVVLLDTDCLVGAVDFPKLIDEFVRRPEIILTNSWNDAPAGPCVILKREGCVRLLHHRIQGNIVLGDSSPNLMLGEFEMKAIFEGKWWNPWPEIKTVRQDFYVNPNDPNPMAFLYCPFVRQPHPDLVQPYLETQSSKAVPLPPLPPLDEESE